MFNSSTERPNVHKQSKLSIDEIVGPDALAVVKPTGFSCWISFATVFSLIYC